MEYLYISKRTKEDLVLSKLPTTHILSSYKNITKGPEKRWGIFILDKEKNEIVGVSSVIEEQEDDVKYLLLEFIFIDEKYRRKNQCYELIKETILKYKKKRKERKKRGGGLIKVVIAGGEPVLKCLIKVFKELKYKIKKYKSDEKENIKNLKIIDFEEAIKIEKRNHKYDIWQTLFFSP